MLKKMKAAAGMSDRNQILSFSRSKGKESFGEIQIPCFTCPAWKSCGFPNWKNCGRFGAWRKNEEGR